MSFLRENGRALIIAVGLVLFYITLMTAATLGAQADARNCQSAIDSGMEKLAKEIC